MAYTHNQGYSATVNGYAVGVKGSEVQVITSGGNVTFYGGTFSSALTVSGTITGSSAATFSGTVTASSQLRIPVATALTSANGSTAIPNYGISGITPSSLAAGYTYYLTKPTAAGLFKLIYRDMTTGAAATGPIYVITSGADFDGTTAVCSSFTIAGTTANSTGPQDRIALYSIGTTHWILACALTTGVTAT